jgi:glycosyltransferase involved in cell wall biosynthesis
MKSAVIIPTYNECENIARLIADLRSLPHNLSVIVVDDNSPDGTGAIAAACAASDAQVQAIHRPAKLGLGTAHIAGFKLALAGGFDQILTMDADYSHHPRYIDGLLQLGATHDLVIGSRYVPGGAVVGSSALRRALSRAANRTAQMVLHLQAGDCTAGFRCYSSAVLHAIQPETIRSEGYSFLIELLWRAQHSGWRISELPITFEDRRFGQSKISAREIFKALATVVRLYQNQGNAGNFVELAKGSTRGSH